MGRRFEGKRVFITGASSGIGAAVALALAGEGARVAVAARRADRLEGVCAKIKAAGGEALPVACDVKDRASLDAAVARTVEAFGGIDLVIANAGFGVTGPFEELSTDAFRRQFDTNVFGVLDTIYAVLPQLTASNGHLAIVSSVLGRIGLPLSSAYCSSKFALAGLAEALYYELAAKGVAVTLILPGVVQSEIRGVDDLGTFHPDFKDSASPRLMVPTDQAAREIVDRLHARKFEAIITRHGRALVWLSRHFSRGFRWVVLYFLAKRDVMGRGKKPRPQ